MFKNVVLVQLRFMFNVSQREAFGYFENVISSDSDSNIPPVNPLR